MSAKTAIGAKVKALRNERKMTIKQLSEASGLSIGFLSQFERGLSSIAIDSLETIADVLGVPLSALFEKGEEEKAAEAEDPIIHGQEVVLTQAGAQMYQTFLKKPHTDYEILSRICTLLPLGEEKELPELYHHKGEEFLYVLEGIITLYLENRVYMMYPGDCVHFASTKKHNWANRTSMIARVLVVNAPNPLKGTE